MADKSRRIQTPRSDMRRGGYESSSKPVSALKPPPKGPAPGAFKRGSVSDQK